jgi:hypothetical protein
MRQAIRLAIAILALGGIAYGLTAERREVSPVREAEAGQEVDGLEFTEGVTQDAYFLRDGRLSDAYSLVPAFAQVRDCKT